LARLDGLRPQHQDVEREHLASVNQAGHWLYSFGVLGAGLMGMLLPIGWLGR